MGTTMTTCTVCGAQQPLVAAYEAAEARAAWEVALKHHPRLAGLLVRYVDLFARKGKAPREATVAKVLTDLQEKLAQAQVVRHGITHAAPLQDWEAALAICTNPDADIDLPLKNNNFLASIVWRRADKAAGKAERAKEETAGTGRRGPAAFVRAADLLPRTEQQRLRGRDGIKAAKTALTNPAPKGDPTP